MIYQISSRQNDKIKEVLKLRKSSYQKEVGLFIVEGFHLIEMASNSNLLEAVYTLEEIKNIDASIPQYIINKDILDKISNYKNSQGALGIVRIKNHQEVQSNLVLYLDDVQDPGNVGTILRTALAFNFLDVILSNNSCSVYNEKVIQASQGAIFDLNIQNGDSSLLKELKNKGYKIIATSLQSSIPLEKLNISEKIVLVLGNEAHGVSKEVLDLADESIRIDIDKIDSLNVAIAGAISMYYIKSQK